MTRYEIIWNIVRKIPHGRVATYGQIAQIAGIEGLARQVGYALHATPRHYNIPWHRVINSQGRISLSGPIARVQKRLLLNEGIIFSASGKIDLEEFKWKRRSTAKEQRKGYNSPGEIK